MKIAFILMLLLSGSCSSKKAKKNVSEKTEQSSVKDAPTLGRTIQVLIEKSQHLDQAQKDQLRAILANNKSKAESLQEQSYKYRAVLIKELLSENANKKEIRILKKDIRRIENEKLKNTFDTVEQISRIVAKNPENQNYIEPLMLIDAR